MSLKAAEVNTVVATVNVGVTPAGLAITPDNNYAYVANSNNYGISGSDAVSVVNLKNNILDVTISSTTFNQPYTVTINPAGTRAYITNSNSTTVSIIDLLNNNVIGTIPGFDGPSGFAIMQDGNTAYVNNYGAPGGLLSGNGKTVHVVDLNTNTILGAPILVDLAPAVLTLSPDGQYLYVANYVDGNPIHNCSPKN